ncbi:MAG: S8 family serine peptidase, partial [Bacteroidota bacterium]
MLRPISIARSLRRLMLVVCSFVLAAPLVFAQSTPFTLGPGERDLDLRLDASQLTTQSAHPAWTYKLDAPARWLAGYESALMGASKASALPQIQAELNQMPYATHTTLTGGLTADVFIDLTTPQAVADLKALNVDVGTPIGTVVTARVPLVLLDDVARMPSVRFIETSMVRPRLNDNGRIDIKADVVHTGGGGLPQAYTGRGVVVGVIDSGIDATHADFSDNNGTRIQHLLEYKADGSQQEWSKAEIDANPASVTQRDGNGGGGHGTHVAGTAAGSGRVNAAYTGIAPESDIIFVKGVRDPNSDGGFTDTDVINGVQYIFDKAGAMGKPAVVNLSLGGHSGPHDGTSLYEQTLSSLSGPGRVIVAAAGNEGSDFIHAGGAVDPTKPNETVFFAGNPQQVFMEMWYKPNAVQGVSIGVYTLANQQLTFVGRSQPVVAGQTLGIDTQTGQLAPVPIEINGQVYGYLSADAQSTQDPRNGDGTILMLLQSNNDPNVQLQQIVWSLIYEGQSGERMDVWISGGSFLGRPLGDTSVNEIPGDNSLSVGSPSTARQVISVGAYTTKVEWTDIDGNRQQHRIRDPNNPEAAIVPTMGARATFSSQGPTRDGRTSPDIGAPGERVVSVLSSHLDLRTSFDEVLQQGGTLRTDVVQGGFYQLLQGTSMASPHVAGLVALMLQADPTLDYDRTVQILQSTARSDGTTGAVPNNEYGYGRVDALAALLQTVQAAGGGGGGGAAVAAVNVGQIDLAVGLDGQREVTFDIQNIGGAPLTYTLTARDPQDVLPSAQATLMPPVKTPMDQGPRLRFSDQSPTRWPRSTPAAASDAASPALSARDILLALDDGDDSADTFFGWGPDGATQRIPFVWMNGFRVGDQPFSLEAVQFFMRTEFEATNAPTITVYDGDFNVVASGTVELQTSQAGMWYEVGLDAPISVAPGQGFFIEVDAANSAIDFPAGTDCDAVTTDGSFFYDWDTAQYVTLAGDASCPAPAFLIRARGALGGGAANQPPVANATASTTQASVGETITFDASGSTDADGQIVSYLWSFGDGTTSTQSVTTHAYAAAGTYALSLTVTD